MVSIVDDPNALKELLEQATSLQMQLKTSGPPPKVSYLAAALLVVRGVGGAKKAISLLQLAGVEIPREQHTNVNKYVERLRALNGEAASSSPSAVSSGSAPASVVVPSTEQVRDPRARRARLERAAALQGRRLHDVASDGRCQFHALLHAVNNQLDVPRAPGHNADSIRAAVLQTLDSEDLLERQWIAAGDTDRLGLDEAESTLRRTLEQAAAGDGRTLEHWRSHMSCA